MAYIKVCASLLPKEVKVDNPVENMTDAELIARIRLLNRELAMDLDLGDDAKSDYGAGGDEPSGRTH